MRASLASLVPTQISPLLSSSQQVMNRLGSPLSTVSITAVPSERKYERPMPYSMAHRPPCESAKNRSDWLLGLGRNCSADTVQHPPDILHKRWLSKIHSPPSYAAIICQTRRGGGPFVGLRSANPPLVITPKCWPVASHSPPTESLTKTRAGERSAKVVERLARGEDRPSRAS